MNNKNIFSYRKFWAERFGIAPVLPMSRAEMENLGWDSCDIIIVTGDAYIDHPSFGMALIGRLLEAQGFRVGIISQPDWHSAEAFKTLGKPNLFFGVTAGNMDSMVNHYTADRKIRSDDAYTPNGKANMRPNRASVVYAQRCREAFNYVPIVLGGIESSLRRIAHYDYWSDTVRHSILLDSKADILLYGNAERALIALAHRLAKKENIADITDLRGTAFVVKKTPEKHTEIDATLLNNTIPCPTKNSALEVIKLPSFEQVKADPLLYAHTSRILHLETNPENARALMQEDAGRKVWLNPPPIPLTTEELDGVYDLPYSRLPHPSYKDSPIPAYEMIRFSLPIMRGCFGGCSFCSITLHEGRIVQSRSEESILREVENIRDKTPGFTGIISDLGGPTANMYRLKCREAKCSTACRRLSCLYPEVCQKMNTDHSSLIHLYRQARKLSGIKKILIGSGVRYDLAVKSPSYIEELTSHHVGGYLKIAPEHICPDPLSKMLKPGIDTYQRFKEMFDRFSKKVGKEQYLIPYFIAAHPGTTDGDMLELALWLKANKYRLDKVQNFIPTPLTLATTMYHTRINPLVKISAKNDKVYVPKGDKTRRLHKAFLRYHDPINWPLLREALKRMGREDLIGNGKRHLVPSWQPR
ncbi:MAG: YgiQ family radical SAM protein [Gammaproteobacteria bacterium]